jgi:hypothetical protein
MAKRTRKTTRKLYCHGCKRWVHMRADGCAHVHLKTDRELDPHTPKGIDLVCPGSGKPPQDQPERVAQLPNPPRR